MASAPHVELPQRLVRTLGAHHPWLAELPRLVERALAHWGLSVERTVVPGGRGSLVVLVRRADGAPAALKLCAAGARDEAAALARWDGHGAVRLLDADPGTGALLLERLHGEVSLRSLPEAKANLEAVSALRRLWVAPGGDHPFATVGDHTGTAAGTLLERAPEEARPVVDEALELRSALLADPPEEVLLHGDFRQGAVLSADTGRGRWLVVGPEPLVGERAYDLARLVRDRLHDLVASSGAPAATRRRVTRLADSLEVDRERLRGWSLYRAVESGVRHVAAGDREDGEALLEFAGWL